MSLRQIAKELEISPAYLSYMINGKRPWRKDLYQRYMGVVNTFVNSDEALANHQEQPPLQWSIQAWMMAWPSPAGHLHGV